MTSESTTLCRFLAGVFAALALTASVADALAQEARRAALVIGNGAYGDIAKLTTAANDANDLAAVLEDLGFQVVKVVDGDKRQMETAIHKFARLATGADAALYYYAGHSLQVDGKNYMMPIDALVPLEQDLDFATIPTALPLRAMERSGAPVKIAILDASRDNPMARVLSASIRAAGRPTVIGQGLAVEQVSERMLVAFAAQPGAIAAGDRGRNSPFSTALLKWIGQPGLDIATLFRRVRGDVMKATDNRQVPDVVEVLIGDFYFAGAAPPVAGAAPRPAPAPLSLAPELEPVEANFAATTNANVRASPTVRSAKVAVLTRGSEVHVLGKVKGKNWYLVERGGKPLGYVFGELLTAPPTKSERTPRPAGPAPAALAKMPKAGETLPPDCADCPEMVVIPVGGFTMGSPTGEDGRKGDEGPRHSVSIARAFALGRYEVTRAEFAAFVRDTGHDPRGCQIHDKKRWRQDDAYSWRDPRFEQTDLDPVVCVGWDDARAYVRWLSRKTGREYRLPSESEWEYAARAGTTTSRYWGEDADQACKYENVYDKEGRSENRFAWKRHDCRDDHAETAPVGGFRANRFGLRDILGNVGEWVADCWNDSYRGAPTDASSWTAGDCDNRVIRGGSWSSASRSARVAARHNLTAGSRVNTVGFRVARTLP